MAIQKNDSVYCFPQATPATRKVQECVLLIEDSEDAMSLVKYALQECGGGRFRLESAKGLSEGLDYLLKSRVEIVLLDLGLPEGRGPSSYAWVREIASNVPVLVLTSDMREETEFAVTASGVDDYLLKDHVSGAVLVHAIDAALYRNKQRQDLMTLAGQLRQPFGFKASSSTPAPDPRRSAKYGQNVGLLARQ